MILLLRSLLFGLLVVSLASADPAPTLSSSSSSSGVQLRTVASLGAPVDAVDAAEDALIAEIDRQAEVVFKDFIASSGSHVPLSVFEKAEREAVYRLKQMHVLTDILKASGSSTATAIIATEVLTTFVLAPLATAFGKPAIAGVLITVPWGMIAGVGVFSYQSMKVRYKVARSLGVWGLRNLDQLRRFMVGYDIKYRVSSIILQSMEESVEFEVLRRSWNANESKMPGVTVKELVEVVRRAPDGPAYLQTIYQEKLDPVFYSALLLRFINASAGPMSDLMTLIKARVPVQLASGDSAALRRHLVGVDDVRTQIERAVRSAQAQKKTLKKRVKAGELSKADAASMKKAFAAEIARLQTVRIELMKHEYGTLLDARRAIDVGADHRDYRVANERTSELGRLALLAHVTPPEVTAARAPIAAPAPVIPLTCQALFN